jgi:hypothetical protein
LAIGAIPDGNVLYRSGTSIIGFDASAAVFAPAVIGDNRIVRGDGGARNVQTSVVSLDDSGNFTGAGTFNGVTVENHNLRHEDGGADEILVEDLPTSGATGTVPVAQSDGSLIMTDPYLIPIKGMKLYDFIADQFSIPNTADWGVNAPAAVVSDPTNSALATAAFDDTTEEGVGMEIHVPSGATTISFVIEHRANTGPTGAQTVDCRLRFRKLTDNGAVGAWVTVDMSPATIGNGVAYYYYTTRTFLLSAISMDAGASYQLEWTRYVGGDDTLTGDSLIRRIRVYVLHDGIRWYPADTMQSALSADWSINANAPIAADSNNSGLKVRLHDDTAEEGCGIPTFVPLGCAKMKLHVISRAETAPTGAQGVGMTLHYRSHGDNAAAGSWIQYDLPTDVAIPANEYWQYDNWELDLATLATPIVPGTTYLLQVTRNPADAGDTLTGDWATLLYGVEFY